MAFPHYSSHQTQDDQRDQQGRRKAHKNLVNSEASVWEVNYILKALNITQWIYTAWQAKFSVDAVMPTMS